MQAGEIPAEIPVFNLSSLQKDSTIIDLLEKSKMVSSRGEGRRLIEQGAVSLDGKVIADLRFMIYEKPGTLKIGKRKWLKCN